MKKPNAFTALSLLSLALVLNLFLLRPGAMGQGHTPYGLAISVALFACVIALQGLVKRGRLSEFKPTGIPRHFGTVIALTTLYVAYESILVLVNWQSNIDFFAKEVVSLAVVFATYGWLLANTNFNRLFFSQFCGVIALLGWSSLVTITVAAFTGFDALYLFSIDVKGYENMGEFTELAAGAVYFPVSMLYTRFTADSFELFRFSHFFREAGIAQAFCCFCLAYEAFHQNRRWVVLGAVAGALTAFSTIGLAILIVTAACVFVIRKRGSDVRKLALTPVFAICGVLILLYAPGIGLEEKAITHSASLDDRSYGMKQGLQRALENPFGTGPFSGTASNSDDVTKGINLIASLSALGFFGVFVQLVLMSGWRFRADRASLQRVVCCLPLMLTALLSQPLVGAPMVYLATLCVISRDAVAAQRARSLFRLPGNQRIVFRRAG